MDVIYDQLRGRQVLAGDAKFHGLLDGDMIVPGPHQLELHGHVTGDVVVQDGAKAQVHGTVDGTVYNNGGVVEIYGTVGSVAGTTPCRIDPGGVIER